LNKANSANEKRNYTEGTTYENTHLDIGGRAVCIDWLRRRTASDDNDDSDARGNDNWSSRRDCACGKRCLRGAIAAGGARRNANRLAGSRLHLDAGLLAMVWNELCLGIGFMEQAAASRGCVGAGTLGASSPWLGLDCRSLALSGVREIDLHRVATSTFLRRDA